ncbi:hypothetical protein [Halomonas halocynthiae]|nr:hypothetical protein [Halomonas halocynthiae]
MKEHQIPERPKGEQPKARRETLRRQAIQSGLSQPSRVHDLEDKQK